MTADLFYLVFKPKKSDATLSKGAQLRENGTAFEAAISQKKDDKRIKQLAEEFAAKVPQLKFSLAGIFSFLLENRESPEEVTENVEQLISKTVGAKLKPPRTVEDAKPGDTRLVCIQRN